MCPAWGPKGLDYLPTHSSFHGLGPELGRNLAQATQQQSSLTSLIRLLSTLLQTLVAQSPVEYS